jgi:TetR/AcrR family transcriptional regulator
VIHSPESPSPSSLRREREREQRRAEILAAAESVFAARDFHDASMETIAETAGFASGTIYLYFEDKDALYLAVLAEKIARMLASIESRVQEQDKKQPMAALKEAIVAQLEFHDQHRAFFEIFSRQRPGFPPGKGPEWKRIRDCYERHAALLCSLIEAAQQRRLLRKLDSRRLAFMLLGMVLQITRNALREPSAAPLAEEAGFVMDLFLHGTAQERRAA